MHMPLDEKEQHVYNRMEMLVAFTAAALYNALQYSWIEEGLDVDLGLLLPCQWRQGSMAEDFYPSENCCCEVICRATVTKPT